MGTSASKFVPEVTATTLKAGMPTVVDVKFAKSITKVLINLTSLQTGRHWMVWLPDGFHGPIIFHDGPTNADPIMMVVHHENKRGTKFAVKLPESPNEKRGPRSETFTWVCGLAKNELYWFEIDVGYETSRRTERFEWRRSHGSEVESLNMATWGWKLVMKPSLPRRQSIGKQPHLRSMGFASDGGEVVAVWGSSHGLNNLGHFELRGRGKTGELGESFILMALASSLTIECNNYQ